MTSSQLSPPSGLNSLAGIPYFFAIVEGVPMGNPSSTPAPFSLNLISGIILGGLVDLKFLWMAYAVSIVLFKSLEYIMSNFSGPSLFPSAWNLINKWKHTNAYFIPCVESFPPFHPCIRFNLLSSVSPLKINMQTMDLLSDHPEFNKFTCFRRFLHYMN